MSHQLIIFGSFDINVSMFLEAKAELKALVQLFKDTLADPEKHMGRLNKEDKVLSGKKLCRKNLSRSWLNFVKV